MAVSYAYEHSFAGGYVKYNVSIPHGRTVFAGDVIAVSGVAKNTNNAFTSIVIYLVTSMYTTSSGSVSAAMLPNMPKFVVSGLSGEKNKEVEFSTTIVMPTISRGDSYEYYSGANKVTGTVANGIPVGLWFYAGDWSKTSWLETWQYAAERCSPAITVFEIQRGTGGIASDEGESALLSLKLSLANTARKSSMTLKLYYAENSEATIDSSYINLTTYIDTMLSGVTENSTLISKTFSNSSAWNFLLVFGDGYEKVQLPGSFIKAFANVHMSGMSTGGICFGGFCKSTEGNPMTESYYPIYAYGGIIGVTDFSTEEVCTYGKWIDDKLIYRKTVTFSVAKNADTTSSVISADMDSVVLVTGTFYRPGSAESEEKWFPINFWYSDTSYANCQVTKEKTIQVRAGWAGTAYVTVFYTKA